MTAPRIGTCAMLANKKLRSYKNMLTGFIIVTTINYMEIEFDTAKREITLAERGLDFARAGEVFAGLTLDLRDERFEYGEERMITFGSLDGRMVVVVWTQRGEARRIISMRKANEREQAAFAHRMG